MVHNLTKSFTWLIVSLVTCFTCVELGQILHYFISLILYARGSLNPIRKDMHTQQTKRKLKLKYMVAS